MTATTAGAAGGRVKERRVGKERNGADTPVSECWPGAGCWEERVRRCRRRQAGCERPAMVLERGHGRIGFVYLWGPLAPRWAPDVGKPAR
jgi:hypothetical protein